MRAIVLRTYLGWNKVTPEEFSEVFNTTDYITSSTNGKEFSDYYDDGVHLGWINEEDGVVNYLLKNKYEDEFMNKERQIELLGDFKGQLENRKYCVENEIAPNYNPLYVELNEIHKAFTDMVSGMWRFNLITESDFDYLMDEGFGIYMEVACYGC